MSSTTSITFDNFKTELDKRVLKVLKGLANDKDETKIYRILSRYGVDDIDKDLIYGELRTMCTSTCSPTINEETKENTEETKENTEHGDDMLQEKARKEAQEAVNKAMEALFDDDQELGKELLKSIQEKENSAIEFIKSLDDKTRLAIMTATTLGGSCTPTAGGKSVFAKLVVQLTSKGTTMIAANGALMGLAAVNVIYMAVLWHAMSKTSHIIKKEIPDIIDLLKRQSKKIRAFAIEIGSGSLINLKELEVVKTDLYYLNLRCSQCISKLSKWEIGWRNFNFKVNGKKLGIGGMIVGFASIVAAIICMATGVGSILVGAIAIGTGVGLMITGGLAVKHAKDCEKYIEGIKKVMDGIKNLQILIEAFRKYTKKKKEIETKTYEELLLHWKLNQYIQNFKDEGWTEIDDWKELKHDDLVNTLNMKQGHAAKFVRLRKKFFMV